MTKMRSSSHGDKKVHPLVRWLINTLDRRIIKQGDPVGGNFHYDLMSDDWHLYADAAGLAAGGVLKIGGVLVEDL
jgi:hypothetical protein